MNKIIAYSFGVFLISVFIFSCSSNFMGSKVDKGQNIGINNPGWKNLKILPKDISDEELKGMMRTFNTSLGVKCSFCHAPGSDGKMDFASDANPKKDVTRDMMNMTYGINKKYFGKDILKEEGEVSCFTCHQGKEKPLTKIETPS